MHNHFDNWQIGIHRRKWQHSFEPLEDRCLLDSTVVFSELMYHPLSNNDDLEWVELQNQNWVDMDLSGWRLSGGIDYEFPAGTKINGRDYLVVAANPTALQNQTGYSQSHGPFTGRLSNGGEQLLLLDNNDRVMNVIDYRDGGRWPVEPDGSGFSLAKIHPDTTSEVVESWSHSLQRNGTPGAFNFAEPGDTVQETLLGESVPVRALVPDNANLGLTWTEMNFDDSSWLSGTTGVGYERGSGYDPFFGLDLDSPPGGQTATPMFGENETVYIRVPFEITTDLSQYDSIRLRMMYDDGFVAYINDTEVASANAPTNLDYNSGALAIHDDGAAVHFVDFDIKTPMCWQSTD